MLARSIYILSSAMFILGAAVPAASAQSVPALNVTATCRDIPADVAGGAARRDSQACLKSEDEARTTLVKDWASYPAADRTLCTQTATMGGTASYVELLTCLEMRRDVRHLPKDELTRIGK
jgi:hypothetical protein